MIIDSHVHLFPPACSESRATYCIRDEWFRQLYEPLKSRIASADELLRSMDAAGVDQSVIAGFPWRDQSLCEAHNAYYREQLGGNNRLRLLCTIQPSAGQLAIDELKRCLDAGFAGLGEMNVDAQSVALSDDEYWHPLAMALIDARATLLLHCSEPVGHAYRGKGHNTPDKVYTFALTYPELKIVAAHWGGGLPFYYLMPELGPSLPNLYFDSAATQYLYDSRIYKLVTSTIGSDRVIFGSDFPLIDQTRALAHARLAGVEDDQPFFGANGAAVYTR